MAGRVWALSRSWRTNMDRSQRNRVCAQSSISWREKVTSLLVVEVSELVSDSFADISTGAHRKEESELLFTWEKGSN